MRENPATPLASGRTFRSSRSQRVIGLAIVVMLLTMCAMPLAYPIASKQALAFLSGQAEPGLTAKLQYEKLTNLLKEELKCQTYWTRTMQVAREGQLEHAVQLYRLALLTRLDQHTRIHEIKRLLPQVTDAFPDKKDAIGSQLEQLPFDILTELHLLYTLKLECYSLIEQLQAEHSST